MAAEEIPEPVGDEFQLLYDRQNFGMPLPEAMKAFAERMPLIDARFFVTAVLTQRETGGNLGEVLDNLAHGHSRAVPSQAAGARAHGARPDHRLDSRRRCRRRWRADDVRARPQHMKMLINDPLGVQMIIGALVLQVIGTLIIRKLVDIPY